MTGYEMFERLAIEIIDRGAIQATAYLNPKFIVRATRVRYGKKIDKRNKQMSLVFTVGRPNYREREFVKLCKKAGESFPIKKIQLKFQKEKKR